MNRVAIAAALLLMSLCANAFTVVIDAGHGGRDAGAVGRKSKEKNINLAVALALGKMIENNCAGVKVVYTRQKDVFVDLDERANIANRAKADLFISIHTNSTASERTPSSPWRAIMKRNMKASIRAAVRAISSSNSCRTRIWLRAFDWPRWYRSSSAPWQDEWTRVFIRQDFWCCVPPACPACW